MRLRLARAGRFVTQPRRRPKRVGRRKGRAAIGETISAEAAKIENGEVPCRVSSCVLVGEAHGFCRAHMIKIRARRSDVPAISEAASLHLSGDWDGGCGDIPDDFDEKVFNIEETRQRAEATRRGTAKSRSRRHRGQPS